ncbi:13288_t:CDS:2 [Entrophospora sp. SA101]|nr:13288_t:CDS:2 [Entrophospora sp. SA101]
MSSAAGGEATSANAATTVTTSATTNLVAASTTPTTTDLPDIIAPFPKKFLYAYAGHLLNNGNNNNFISTQQQKLQLQQIQQKMTSHTTTTTAPTTDVTNDSPWGLSAALACAELMEIMGNSSRGSSRPVSFNSYDELKAIEIEKMRQRPFTISTSTLNASSSSTSGSTTTSPTTIRPSRLAQRSKQFPHNHNQQQLLRPTSLYQTNNYYYDNNNKNDSGIEGETNFYDGDLNNENAASDITKVGGISRMINNLNDNSFENVSKIPHNLSKASKTAIFMSISEGGRRRSLSVGSAGLKTGSKIIGC